jgi:short-subunit dehydrogenase
MPVMALPPPTLDATVMITGASTGIGAALARELAERSYNLVLVARRAPSLDALAEELPRDHGVHVDIEAVDLTDAKAREALVARLARGEREVVGVCNSAGVGSVGRFAELPLERERDIVRLNVEALHHLTGAFLPRMLEQGIGAVLNVASTAAYQPVPGLATYAATKAFVQSFSEAVHAELEGTGVSVTCLSPGPTRTRFGEVAGLKGSAHPTPDFLFSAPQDVARAGVDAMVAGRRSAVPGLSNKLSATGGRLIPRSLLLPLARRVNAERLGEASRLTP